LKGVVVLVLLYPLWSLTPQRAWSLFANFLEFVLVVRPQA
jgi:hypothetical protein